MIAGIDIGTCYSSICVLNKEGKAEAVKTSTGLGLYGNDYSLPSAVFVEREKILVGQAAYNSRMKAPENFKSEFKRDFGQTIPYHLGNQTFLPEDLYKELFVHMKICAETYTGESLEHAYVTHPSRFTEDQKKRLKQSANRAGIMNVTLVEEPVAAAFHYVVEHNLEEDKTLLVYDFGGGTFDVALIGFRHGEFELLSAPSGIERCGGIDVDKLIYDNILQNIPSELKEAVNVNPKLLQNFKSQVNEDSIKAKHHLSVAEEFQNGFQVIYDFVDYFLDRTTLNALISPIVEETLHCVRSLIDRAGINASGIDAVLLVGGSSRIPLVKDALAELLQKSVMENVDPDLAIAMGAAAWGKRQDLSCGYKAGKDNSGKWGFYDMAGKAVLTFIYEEAKDFSENRAVVKMNGKWGVIDQIGRNVCSFEYDELYSYNQGLARGRKGNNWGFLNRIGTNHTEFKYQILGEFSEDLCPVKMDDLWGYIALDGSERIPAIYNHVYEFINGKAKVERDNKVGYIDTSGNELISCFYDEISEFINGMAKVRIRNLMGYIDESGCVLIPCIYEEIGRFNNGRAKVKVDKKIGFVDELGNECISCFFDEASDFFDECAKVKVDKRWGFIDVNGRAITKFIYHSATLFEKERSIVSIDYKYGVIDIYDNMIIPIKYADIEYDCELDQFIILGNKAGRCSLDGKNLNENLFDSSLVSLRRIRGNKKMNISGFYIGKYAVTQYQWERIMKDLNTYRFKYYSGDNLPAIYVSWIDALTFCNKLSIIDGYEPLYNISEDNVELIIGAKGYRLPTEKEWIYAASGVENQIYAGTDYKDSLKSYAWFNVKKPHPVGEKYSNGFGLYDMSGNVNEWCWDKFDDVSENRIVHGGSWLHSDCATIQSRIGMNPHESDMCTGFRIILEI